MRIDPRRAANRGVRYLEGSADNGLWRDFKTLAGEGVEWVTAFVAYSIQQADPGNRTAVTAATQLACSQRENGGWGFNADVPSDCDSTAWAVLAAVSSGVPIYERKALAYLQKHRVAPEGGFATYAPEDGISERIGLAAPNWQLPHACVTAVALRALAALASNGRAPESRACTDRYLLEKRLPSGLWQSYWWVGSSYCTYQSLVATKIARRFENADEQCTRTFLNRQRPDGGWACPGGSGGPCVFETGFALLCLQSLATECGSFELRAGLERGLAWLVNAQERDGSWASAPILLIPSPRRRSAGGRHMRALGTDVVVQDERRSFSTAAALLAISGWLKAWAPGP